MLYRFNGSFGPADKNIKHAVFIFCCGEQLENITHINDAAVITEIIQRIISAIPGAGRNYYPVRNEVTNSPQLFCTIQVQEVIVVTFDVTIKSL